MLELGVLGTARRKTVFKMSKAKVAIAYPKYNENICLLITSGSWSYFTTKAGIAKPNPDPKMLQPTNMEVAKVLYFI